MDCENLLQRLFQALTVGTVILVVATSLLVSVLGKGPTIDLYNQKGGKGPNQPSDTFSPGEQVILYAYVTYKDDPVEGKLVAFEMIDPTNTSAIYRTGETNASGLATVNFTLPTAGPPEQIIGTWTAIAVVSIAEETVRDTLFFSVRGPMIDLYTQRDGKGAKMASDAFAPQEEVVLYAYVTYNLDPVEGKLVAFEVIDANDTCVTYKTAATNASGIANMSFRIPSMPVFGTWLAIGTVHVVETTVADTLTFEVGWIVYIIKIETVNEHGEIKTSFVKGEHVHFNLTVQSIALVSKIATFTIVTYDEQGVPVGQIVLHSWVIPPGASQFFIIGIQVPKWVYIGVATVYANAYTNLPQNGGVPYCPEISVTLMIVSS